MHHSEQPYEEPMKSPPTDKINYALDKLMREEAKREGLGATGEFPQGQLQPSDEGEIKIGITYKDGKVIINFGKPIAWIGLDPKQARSLAEMIRQNSYKAEQK